jgi:hypothetical protein
VALDAPSPAAAQKLLDSIPNRRGRQ